MQEQVFLNEAAPARIDAVASDLSLSRKAILQEASYRYLEGLEWQAKVKAGRDDAAQGNIPPADDVERSFSARRSALRAGGPDGAGGMDCPCRQASRGDFRQHCGR